MQKGRKGDFSNKTTFAPEEAYAPYNFVPFSKKIIKRYENSSDLPDYEKIDSSLKTGEIEITLEAKTPVYVSNGKSSSKDKSKEDFFKGADGKYQIPSSSIRGMLRENMQVLGFGLIRPDEDISDYRIYFREMATSSGKGDGSAKKYYRNNFNVNNATIPERVHAGYIRKRNGDYYLKTSRYIRISRNHPGLEEIKENGRIPDARTWEVAYIENYTENDTERAAGIKTITLSKSKKEGMRKGILLSTGRPVSKPNPLYVFEEEDMEEDGRLLSEKDVLAYCEDLENRKNVKKDYQNFWALPKEGESKPFFYIKIGDHFYWGCSLYLRIGYPHSIGEGLPEVHKDHYQEETEQNKKLTLDYPYSVLGFARDNEAYRSRVSVGNFPLVEGKRTKEEYCVLGAEPRPSYYLGYLGENKSYASNAFSLRGYKQYWLRENIYKVQPPDNKKMYKMVRPFDKESKFKGVIRFKNLHEDELGLLLWCLTLKPECYQSIGMGKPYGLGGIKTSVTGLKILNTESAYSFSGFCNAFQMQTDKIDVYIEKYRKYASDKLKEVSDTNKKINVEDYPEIKDFFFMHKISPLQEDKMKYMSLKEYQNAKKPLKTVREIREKFEGTVEGQTDEDSINVLLSKWGATQGGKKQGGKNEKNLRKGR